MSGIASLGAPFWAQSLASGALLITLILAEGAIPLGLAARILAALERGREPDVTGSDDDNPALGRDWFPSPWGAEDQRGNANLLGPPQSARSARPRALRRDHSAGFPYTPRMPFSPGRSFTLTLQGGPDGTGGPVGAKSRTVWNDDFVAAEVGQMGTHMDALGHLGHQRLMGCGHCRTLLYNGNRSTKSGRRPG